MIKFVYFTDPHTMPRIPGTRTDNYPTTIESKIRDAIRYGHEQNVDFFACGGDFMDSPYVGERYVRKLGKLFKEELKGKELFFVWGNHDMVAWNPKTVEDTAFGLYEYFSDEFTLLTKEPTYREYNGQRIALTGVSSYANLDVTLDTEKGTFHRSRDYVINDTDVPHIHIVHGYLSPKPILEDIRHTVVEEIINTKATITLTGHEHTGFPPIILPNGNIIHNPGALARVFASHTEMNRMPQFDFCVIDDDGTPSVTPIQSRVASVGTEVMDREALDEKKKQEEFLKATQGSIREVLDGINIERVDLKTIVERFKDNVSPKAYEEVKRRLGLI